METAEPESYFTCDNGARPFLVHVDDNHVSVYRIPESKETFNQDILKSSYTELVGEWDTLKIFIGKSPFNQMTEFSGGHGSTYDGNSILIQIDLGAYIFIGGCIYSFNIIKNQPIIEFESPVGNNCVPYPVATDAAGMQYLMIEKVIIPGVSSTSVDPYARYYANKLITADECRHPPKRPFRMFHDIVEFYIDENQYTFTYHPFPETDYEETIERLGETMYVVRTDGIKYELTKPDYVKLMQDVGKF